MKNAYARYNLLFFIFIIPSLGTIALFALFAQPVTGDLTRLGGYLEEDFGWVAPQQVFERGGFKSTKTLNDYDHYYDMVVLGDSFSEDTSKCWQNYFYQRTGLSMVTLYLARPRAEAVKSSGVDVASIVNSKEFREHPPRYFVYETVERSSFSRLSEYADKSWASQFQNIEPLAQEKFNFPRPLRLPTIEITRDASPGIEVKLQQSVNYLVKAINRLKGESGQIRVLPLTRSDLFSNGRSDELLILGADFEKDLSAAAVARALRGLRAIQGLVESNGKTRFMLLIFPDKLTAYAPYLKNQEQTVPSYLPALSAHFSFPRLDESFHKALHNGVKDLYLPDNSHTGYIGYKIGAETLIDFYLSDNDEAHKNH